MANKVLIKGNQKRFQRAAALFERKLLDEQNLLWQHLKELDSLADKLAEVDDKLTQTRTALDACLAKGDMVHYKDLFVWLDTYQQAHDQYSKQKEQLEKTLEETKQRLITWSQKKERSNDREFESLKQLGQIKDDEESLWFTSLNHQRKFDGN